MTLGQLSQAAPNDVCEFLKAGLFVHAALAHGKGERLQPGLKIGSESFFDRDETIMVFVHGQARQRSPAAKVQREAQHQHGAMNMEFARLQQRALHHDIACSRWLALLEEYVRRTLRHYGELSGIGGQAVLEPRRLRPEDVKRIAIGLQVRRGFDKFEAVRKAICPVWIFQALSPATRAPIRAQ